MAVLHAAHAYIGEYSRTGYDISPAAEWLLDNFHLIEAQAKEIRTGLSRSYFRTLPVLQGEPLAGLPRIYGVAWAFTAHTDSAFDDGLLVQFLSAYQEVCELKLGELWALPTTLRVVLLENLRRLADRIATHKAAREAANLCFDDPDAYTVADLEAALVVLQIRGVDTLFLAQMAQRALDRRTIGESPHPAPWGDWLHRAVPDLAALQRQQTAEQAADNLSVSNAVHSLRLINDTDWNAIIAQSSGLVQTLLRSALFAAEDAATRDQTLHAIEGLARRCGHTEVGVAQVLLTQIQAGDPGDAAQSSASYWLQGAGRSATLRRLGISAWADWRHQWWRPQPLFIVYAAAVMALSVWAVWATLHPAAPAAPSLPWLTFLGALLMLFPASEAVIAVVNRLISESARPRYLPRLALATGIPAQHRVLVVVPAMLSHANAITELIQHLERHYLANAEPLAQFAVLTDWLDAPSESTPQDAGLLALAVDQIRTLNRKYPRLAGDIQTVPRFLVLHRPRKFSASEQSWIGWERKRGKLECLVAAMFSNVFADFLCLDPAWTIAPHTPYIVTLDSDTQLPPGRLRDLVGIAAHPFNQPGLDPARRKIVTGYGILQPRIATPLPSGRNLTAFHWLFAGQCGVDTYSAASSEVYQDLFGEGTFIGKGLLHVQALHQVLAGRLPHSQILSHDLLEGALARCAAVTDVHFIEEAPFHPDVAAARVHRWTRGDWQLLPTMVRAIFHPDQVGLSAVHLWKMGDNLRRSLVGPAALALLLIALGGYLLSPWRVLVIVLAAYGAGPVLGALAGFATSRDGAAKQHFYTEALIDLARASSGALWHLVQLVQQSMMYLHAVGLALYRTLYSHRKLLQWTTAETAQSTAKRSLIPVLRQHAAETVIALMMMGLLLRSATPYVALSVVLCSLWCASPFWTWCASRTRRSPEQLPLTPTDQGYLLGIARDTWRLFERCVSAQDNFLPPDNLQRSPHDMLAHRTSPTNIGLYLLSVACARQFGWIGTLDLRDRLEATLATLMTLQRHNGHFLNWYDTRTCEPLLPQYVSAVDSGNLCGHLITVAQSCRSLASASWETVTLEQALQFSHHRMALLLARRRHLNAQERARARLLIADYRATRGALQRDRAVAISGDSAVAQMAAQLTSLADRLEALALQAQFGFLYNTQRRLLHIGYRIDEQQCDAGFYDLLASESRLTSLLAIAKGDISVRHWAALGRPFFAEGRKVGLKSWTGSMFEYLMPTLVLDEPRQSVLRAACFAALCEQVRFATGLHTPWGISESAYAASDHTLAYQYAPQGAPRLALRRTPPDEMVIAPYATALACMITPHLAIRNFRHLEALGARGDYGFIEALDYSPARCLHGDAFTSVNTFMAHHQGMTIVSLANVLMDFCVQKWTMAYPPLQAAVSLLHERIPREVPPLQQETQGLPQKRMQRRRSPGVVREVVPGQAAVEATHLLSNGRYTVAIRPNGSGWSHWGATAVGRQRDDALRDAQGSFLYLRRHPDAAPVSLSQNPAGDPSARYTSAFHADRLCLDAVWPDLTTRTTTWVSPEDDIEFRQVDVHNLTDSVLRLELIAAMEVTLAHPNADESHPAFSNMFVRAQWLAEHRALLFERRSRLATESGLHLAHFVISSTVLGGIKTQTDRQRWRGRNRADTSLLAAMDSQLMNDAADGGATELTTGLDPMCALGVELHIPPRAGVQVTFATAASDSLQTLHSIIDKYQQHANIRRASLMSATLAGIRLRASRITASDYVAVQAMTTALVHTLSRPPSSANRLDRGAWGPSDRALLWRFGLSGDRPYILVSVGAMQGTGLLRSLVQALGVWSWAGLACDLVVINSEPSSYLMEVQREINFLRERFAASAEVGKGDTTPGFLSLPLAELSAPQLATLTARARLCLVADGRPLSHHINEWTARHSLARGKRDGVQVDLPLSVRWPGATTAPAGQFAAGSGAFSFTVDRTVRPLRPWMNVLANPGLGAHLTESGGGYTWAQNSRLHQLTPWSNDAVADPCSEWFLLQDLRTRAVWSISPGLWADPEISYEVTHRQGSSTIRHIRGPLEVTATWCVDSSAPVKQVSIELRNTGNRTLHLRAVAMLEWIMGAGRTERSSVQTGVQITAGADTPVVLLTATQQERSLGFGEGTAFLCSTNAGLETDTWTCDRREFFTAQGQMVLPQRLLQTSGAGIDPCAALSSEFTLLPGGSERRNFLIGHGATPAQAAQIAAHACKVASNDRFVAAHAAWDQLLDSTAVTTPDPLFDALVNRWLLYQTLVCRLWSKAGFYQAGGATGFRDQLQDTMALAWAAPHLLREQIVLCASRQFEEGDVQHWWHAPSGAGVRTHFSDDLLWLPYACAHYVRTTGDTAVLDHAVAFLEGAAVPPGAEDAYYIPQRGTALASVYEHAARSIDRSLRVGAHGLPLMGSGDWNDGMNLVGREGQGESVWLGWFLCQVVHDFAPLAQQRGDVDRVERWLTSAAGWQAALCTTAWDGEWFKRAFFDGGQALGSRANAEAHIDLIAQAWAVLSDVPPADQQRRAMHSADVQLVDPQSGLIKLLTPALQHAQPSAGYIQAYPPGVRENAGQYTHAGVWALMAAAELQQRDAGSSLDAQAVYRYFTYLSPAHRAADPRWGAVYGLEPYVVAGDVYSEPPYIGRGGWSWYTGAAAWLYRAAHESVFGMRRDASGISFAPCLPGHWPRAEIRLSHQGHAVQFVLLRMTAQGARDTALAMNAQVLPRKEVLQWQAVTGPSSFVIPLL